MGLVVEDDGRRILDELLEQIEPLLPPRRPRTSSAVTARGCRTGTR
jgi:hypothetical protein